MTVRMMKVLVTAAGLMLVGCHDGGRNDWNDIHKLDALPAGNYQLSFSMDSSSASSPVNGVDLTVKLPSGVTIASDKTGRISNAALSTGSDLKGISLIVGQYAADKRQAHLNLTTTTATVWKGEFARMTVTIPAGVSVSEYTLMKTVMDDGFPTYKVMGLSASTHDTVSMTRDAQTTVKLLR